MNMAQISMCLMKVQDVALEILKVVVRLAVIQFQILTIIFVHNGKVLDLIKELIQNLVR